MKSPNKQAAWILVALAIALSGCSNIPDAREISHARIEENRENLKKIKIGITQSEVLEIMGSPQDSSPGPRQARHLAFWMYQTEPRDLTSWTLSNSCFTWMAFEGERLMAIGAEHEVIPFNDNHPLWKPNEN